jgi:hypothetical protein
MSKPLVTYFLNWMGPINKKWIEEHGGNWAAGRIDIHDPNSDLPYSESYGVPLMDEEDWHRFGAYLHKLKTLEVRSFKELVGTYEVIYGKIRWKDDN